MLNVTLSSRKFSSTTILNAMPLSGTLSSEMFLQTDFQVRGRLKVTRGKGNKEKKEQEREEMRGWKLR